MVESIAIMRAVCDKERWFFVDEAGDPNFYGKGKKNIVGTVGCSLTFSVGFLRTTEPQVIRDRLTEVRNKVASDRYLKYVPSITKSLVAFHAKDDCPEVRYLVYKALEDIRFRAQVIVARKIEDVFSTHCKGSKDEFYDLLVRHLFRNQMHIAERNFIIFSKRGNKDRQHSLRQAVNSAIHAFQKKYNHVAKTEVSVGTSQPPQEPVLQAADYVMWAVQRAFEKGDMRYFDWLREKIQLVWDLYDFAKGRHRVYNEKRNPFHVEKITPLRAQDAAGLVKASPLS